MTSVGATAPIASSGGATPTISISQASSTTNGYLSSTDWNTFNNKTSNTGTVTSVAMTVPTGLSISGTPITTSGTLALTLTAGYSIPTTASQTNWDSAYTQRLQWDGGSTNLVAATGRTSLGGTTVGQNFFTLTNPSAITFPRINADNTVSALDAATFRSAIGAGTGTVTSVSGTGTVSGLTLSGTVTSSGSLTLGGTLSVTPAQVSDQANTSTGFFDIPVGTTAQRGSPTSGSIRYNTSTSSFEIYDGTNWLQISAQVYANPPPSLEYLIVAGGGSGGGNSADGNQRTGGGGAGGYRTATGLTFSSNTALTVTVGSGGATASGDVSYSGNSSSFNGITSTGGGGGGNQGNAAYTGGSGGGGSSGTTAGAAGTAGQGNSGANSTGYNGNGGGGGGAGSAGSGANGGSGSASSITGTSVTRAGGGAGTNGSGGSGGGGNPSTAGSVNTGSGGGGGFASAGGAGGSGIVVIRYSNTYDQASSSYLSGTYSYANTGGYHTYTFTGSGSIGWRG